VRSPEAMTASGFFGWAMIESTAALSIASVSTTP
jgi:hypothetical protein